MSSSYTEGSPDERRTPIPLDALAWGSRSIRSVRRSERAIQDARFTEVVVLRLPLLIAYAYYASHRLIPTRYSIKESLGDPTYHKMNPGTNANCLGWGKNSAQIGEAYLLLRVRCNDLFKQMCSSDSCVTK